MKTFSKMAVAAIALMGASIGAAAPAMAANYTETFLPITLTSSQQNLQGLPTALLNSANPGFSGGDTFTMTYGLNLPAGATGLQSSGNSNNSIALSWLPGNTFSNLSVALYNGDALLNGSVNGVQVTGPVSVLKPTVVTYTGLTSSSNPYELVVTGTSQGQSGGYSLAVSSVPIPGAVVLFGSGLLGLAGFARRSAKAQVG